MGMNKRLADTARLATAQVLELFPAEKRKTMPKDATLESLWAQILELENVPRARPKVEDCVRHLIENKDLAILPISIIAEIIRTVFLEQGFPSKCSESSVRWYLSQRQGEWNIVRRKSIRGGHVGETFES